MRLTMRVPQGSVGDLLLEFGKRKVGVIEEIVESAHDGFMKAEVLFDSEVDYIRYKALVRKRWKMVLFTQKEMPAVVPSSEIKTPEKANEVAQVFMCKR